MKASTGVRFLGATPALLFLLTGAIIVQGANDEPYFRFSAFDAICQIGVAMVLMASWTVIAVAIIVAVVRRKCSAWWLASVFAIFVIEFLLYQSPSGYVHDMIEYTKTS